MTFLAKTTEPFGAGGRTSGQILEITPQLLATIPEYKTEAVTWVKRYTAAVIEPYISSWTPASKVTTQ